VSIPCCFNYYGSKNQQPNELIGKWTEQIILKIIITKAKKHMKKCSTSSAIKEKQIKVTLRLHLTLVRVAIINNKNNKKSSEGCRRKGTFIQCW
jgi:hypothetical protein